MPAKEKIRIVTPQELVAAHEETIKKSLLKNHLIMKLVVDFPKHNHPPLMGRLGAWLVNKAGGNIAMKYGINDTINSKVRPNK